MAGLAYFNELMKDRSYLLEGPSFVEILLKLGSKVCENLISDPRFYHVGPGNQLSNHNRRSFPKFSRILHVRFTDVNDPFN